MQARPLGKMRWIIGLLVFLPLLITCTVVTKKTAIAPQIQTAIDGEYQVSERLRRHPPRTVAILPFVNRTDSDQAFEVVRRTFYNHFSSLRYVDLELYQVDARLQQAGLTEPEAVAATSPQRLGEILGVEAVILGEVTHYDRIYAGLYSQVAVGAHLRMLDCASGELLWEGRHTERKHQGGVSTTPVGLILTAISTAVNVREIELFRTSDDLFRTMIKALPSPTLGEARRPPKINILVQDGVGKPKKAGEVIKVAMEGEPRLQATFDIGTMKTGIPMREESPGSYVGEYRVLPGDNIDKAFIVGHLTDDAGNTSDWIDVLGSVSIDTEPPVPPAALRAVGRDRKVMLSWLANQESDLAAYRVYRSDTPLTGFTPVGDTELTSFEDQGLTNGRTYYYQVSALDLAGNQSAPSATAAAHPVAPGPTPVQGLIGKDLTWFAGASPYVVTGEITVADKATLTVEPGTEIVSSGPGILVRGRLLAQGTKAGIIKFVGKDKGKWQGIRIVDTGQGSLEGCLIRDAAVGVDCEATSPRITGCEFADNDVGIRISRSFARPEIKQNIFRANRVAGLEIRAAAAPQIKENQILNNRGVGVEIAAAAGVLANNSISNNQGGGVLVKAASVKISHNSIVANQGFDLRAVSPGATLQLGPNWWGTTDVLELLTRVQGKVELASALDGPPPQGNEFQLPIHQGEIRGEITQTTYLLKAHSPYIVAARTTVDKGATLVIQPGVELRYNPGDTAIVVKNGGIRAEGTPEEPIVFAANSSTGSPGYYRTAVWIQAAGSVPTIFKYCVFRHASTGLIVDHGTPEIAYCLIADNSQSGVQCRNNATPRILYSTLRDNRGTGAIECYGRSAPQIHHNNIYRNPFAIQSFSTLYVDARENWWGGAAADPGLFIGQINRSGALSEPVTSAFDPGGHPSVAQ